VTPLVVLDASAAAEIVARTTDGRRLLALAPSPRRWVVPDHFHVETAGALRRMLNQGLISEERADRALSRVLALPALLSASKPLVAEAWAYRHNLIVQDAAYVVLADHLGAPLLTGDRKLAKAPNLPIQVLHLSADD
jgi:predicted nucleic acid-binding protein